MTDNVESFVELANKMYYNLFIILTIFAICILFMRLKE